MSVAPLLVSSSLGAGTPVPGSVVGLKGGEVAVALTDRATRGIADDGGGTPQPGDPVRFFVTIDSFEVEAGAGTVRRTDPGGVWVEITEGQPGLDAQAVIDAGGPGPDARSEAPASWSTGRESSSTDPAAASGADADWGAGRGAVEAAAPPGPCEGRMDEIAHARAMLEAGQIERWRSGVTRLLEAGCVHPQIREQFEIAIRKAREDRDRRVAAAVQRDQRTGDGDLGEIVEGLLSILETVKKKN